MRKIWRELEQGNEWVVDADLKDFFGSADHDKLMEMLRRLMPSDDCRKHNPLRPVTSMAGAQP